MKIKPFYLVCLFSPTLLVSMHIQLLFPLKNGAKIAEGPFFTTCYNLDKLRKEKYSHFEELVAKARNDQYEIKNNEVKSNLLTQKFLVDEKGNIDEGCRNIILSGVKDKDNRLMLYDPTTMCDPSVGDSRGMFDGESVPADK